MYCSFPTTLYLHIQGSFFYQLLTITWYLIIYKWYEFVPIVWDRVLYYYRLSTLLIAVDHGLTTGRRRYNGKTIITFLATLLMLAAQHIKRAVSYQIRTSTNKIVNPFRTAVPNVGTNKSNFK